MLEIGLTLALAVVLGGAVGLERELTGKAAGLRTNILIALGAAVFTMVSVDAAGRGADPARIAAQVVTGVGFIGAGAIIQARGSVVGLTTAATIWAVAGIGMAVGAQQTLLASLATLAIILCLTLLRRIDLAGMIEKKIFDIEITAQHSADVSDILRSLSETALEMEVTHISKRADELAIRVECAAKPSSINEILASLLSRDDVSSTRVKN